MDSSLHALCVLCLFGFLLHEPQSVPACVHLVSLLVSVSMLVPLCVCFSVCVSVCVLYELCVYLPGKGFTLCSLNSTENIAWGKEWEGHFTEIF